MSCVSLYACLLQLERKREREIERERERLRERRERDRKRVYLRRAATAYALLLSAAL